MVDLVTQDRKIFWSVFIFIAATFLALNFFNRVNIEKQVAEATPETIEGAISKIERSSAYVKFEVNGQSFHSQEHTEPCLDIIDEVESGRLVNLEFVYIKEWPSYSGSGNCVLKATFLTSKKARSGRSKINT